MPSAETRFAQAMGAAGRKRTDQPAPAAAAPKVVPMLRKGDIHLGDEHDCAPVGLSLAKLLEGRLLIQGASGAGKSWTLRRLLEQSSAMVQQILIDPEGEFRSLAEEYEMVVVDATRLDAAAIATVAYRAREHRISLLVDLSELDREEQMKMFAPFISALVDAPKHHWHPCLVAVDEAHLFAPFGGQSTEPSSVRKQAIGALVDLMSRGRKRGLCGAIATQRLARLSKSVVSEVHNFLIGINTLDLDIRRAAETIGWDARRGFDFLPRLQPGEFVAVGPAFARNPTTLKVGSVDTRHIGAAPELKRPELLEPDKAAALLDLEGLLQATADDNDARAEQKFVPSLRAVRTFIHDPAFAVAGAVWKELTALRPNGALVRELAKLCGRGTNDALALLDRFGTVEFTGDGSARAVRIADWQES